MVNKVRRLDLPMGWLLCGMLIPGIHPLCGQEATVHELNQEQQNVLLLRAELEREKVKAELRKLTVPTVISSELCSGAGLGLLSLRSIYGAEGQLSAQFWYGPNLQVEGTVGDVLACSEKIVMISEKEVQVERHGVIYSVTAQSALGARTTP